jgi:membrane protease subunit HflK
MAWKKIKIGGSEFEVSTAHYWTVILVVILVVVGVTIFMSFYTVDANENGIILRFGKYSKTTYPGLHLKLPWGIDKLYKVKVDYNYKEEFGFRTLRPGVKSQYAKGEFADESWMLTGDLNIADVKWIVQYRIQNPVAYLFNVRDVGGTLRDVSEASMRLIVGDRSFHEVLQSDRRIIADLSKEYMQDLLDLYNSGLKIQLIQLKDVHPPEPVRDSFNEVNRAKQEQETAINEASQIYNREIYRVEGEADRIVREAEGYSINRTNRAKGDAELFISVFEEYMKAKDVTRQRLYIETLEEVLSKIDKKYVVDKDLKGIVPLLNLTGSEVAK